MATSIDRVNFYERQYLRAFDLLAEQEYHLEMRRRLNLALHLWGIVDGFDVAKGSVVPGAPEQFIISPGMAIDGYGREIVMAQPYALSSEDVRRNRIIGPLDCWLAIAYRSQLTTPPSPGFRLCDLKDQYTRLHETFEILILQDKPAPAPVAVEDPLSDDPNDDWPVVLGKVHVTLAGEIDTGWLQDRVYIGTRTEHLVAPMASLSPGATEYDRPIRIEAHAQAQKNLTVGDDFSIDNSKVVPAPTGTIPTASGNVKVAADLFVKGEIYKYHAGRQQWLALKEQLKQLMPDVRLPDVPNTSPFVVLTAINAVHNQPSTGTQQVSVTTPLLSPSKADLFVSLAGLKWLSHANENLWVGALGVATNTPVQASLRVLPNPVKTSVANGTKYDFQVEWTVAPTVVAVGVQPLLMIELHVSCLAIFQP